MVLFSDKRTAATFKFGVYLGEADKVSFVREHFDAVHCYLEHFVFPSFMIFTGSHTDVVVTFYNRDL